MSARIHTPVVSMVPMTVSSHRITAFPVTLAGQHLTFISSLNSLREEGYFEAVVFVKAFWPPYLLATQTVPTSVPAV